jgi:hypothetical protein
MSHCTSRILLSTGLLLLLLAAGCSSSNEVVPVQQESAAQTVISRLQGSGIDAVWETASPDVRPVDFFGPGVQQVSLLVEGPHGSSIDFYCFSDAGLAVEAAAAVSRDGFTVPTGEGVAMVSWVGPPHFFRKDRLIVLYVEQAGPDADGSIDRRILDILRDVMGEQFAGNSASVE